jgi:chromosomal replication initiator protein
MDSLWPEARRVLKQTLTAEQFRQWIEPLKVTALQSGHLVLQAPSRFHYYWIEEHYLALIQSSCRKIDSGVRLLLQKPDGQGKSSKTHRPFIGNVPLMTTFQTSQTFENYVLAPFNRFAFAAAKDVCQDATAAFNPLFIEGPPGLGKTHLLHAIGNDWQANKDGSAAYLSCRNLLVFGPSTPPSPYEALWQTLGGLKVLLVDDVHHVPPEENFQQHLREIFNWCYDVGTRMVFTATRLPHQIPDLSLGLRSRLGWGLIARIPEPDIDGCYQVIETFLGVSKVPASKEICQYLADQGPPNFHEIKDFVEKLQEIVEKEGSLPSLKERSLAIHGNTTPRPERLSMQAIQKEVCASYGVSLEALPGATKSRPLVIARQVGMYLSRKLTGSTYAAIGGSFGGRDHSTVIYACRKVRAEIRRNRVFAERIVEIEKKLLEDYKKEITETSKD